jgi:hypothetical protein
MGILGVCAVGLFGLAAASAPASNGPAELQVFAWTTGLSQTSGFGFEFDGLDSAGEAERVTTVIPSGYGVNLAHAVGTKLGGASLITHANAWFDGALVEMDPAAYASNPSAESCDPGTHVAVWVMNVSKGGTTLAIPIAVDQVASGYRLTICFDNEHAQALAVSGISFYVKDWFTNPTSPGRYMFDAIVTPFAADGSPSASSAYELRAYEPLPRALTTAPTYNPRTKVFAVSGVLTIQGKLAAGVPVAIFNAGVKAGPVFVGSATTGTGGKYTFKKRLARAPKYEYSLAAPYVSASCPAPSPAPAGCVSLSTDVTNSATRKVALRRNGP